MLFLLLIGTVNLWIGFGLDLYVVRQARETHIGAGAQ